MRQSTLVLWVILTVASTACLADEAMRRATPDAHQALKDCVRKHQMQDVNLSKRELNRLCKDELKAQKTSGSSAPPPEDPPRP